MGDFVTFGGLPVFDHVPVSRDKRVGDNARPERAKINSITIKEMKQARQTSA